MPLPHLSRTRIGSRSLFLSLLLLLVLAAALSPPLFGQSPNRDAPAANPGRPTVATPATLTPVGYLQFETGWLYATGTAEFSSQSSLGLVTKLAVAPRLQALALTQPFAVSNESSGRETQPGDIFLGVQAVALTGQGASPTVSLSYIGRIYEGPAPNIDIGTNRQSALLLISNDLGEFHFDLNGMLTEQSDDVRLRRAQFGQTISISHPLGKFTVAGELWHYTQPLTQGNAVGNLWALSYNVRPNLVFDSGFNHGLTSSSTQWEGFAGFTYLLPHRLWQK
jgi:hypothetical protein